MKVTLILIYLHVAERAKNINYQRFLLESQGFLIDFWLYSVVLNLQGVRHLYMEPSINYVSRQRGGGSPNSLICLLRYMGEGGHLVCYFGLFFFILQIHFFCYFCSWIAYEDGGWCKTFTSAYEGGNGGGGQKRTKSFLRSLWMALWIWCCGIEINFKNGPTSEEWSPSSNIFSKSKSTLTLKTLWEAYNQLFPARIMPRAYKVGFILYFVLLGLCFLHQRILL